MLKRIAALVIVILPVMASAQESWEQRLTIHGFGEWAYVRTDGNEYLGGTETGEYDRSGLALNVAASLSDQLRVVGQIAVRNAGENTVARLDYAFAEWVVSDRFQIRAGKSKHPFGIYNEIYDVGTLRPFFFLPQGFYGPTQGYNGVGISGTVPVHDWELDYDVYGGEIGTPAWGGTEADLNLRLRDAIGARVRFHLPVKDLTLGVSAYQGRFEEVYIPVLREGALNRAWNVHLDYSGTPVTVRAEYSQQHEQYGGSAKPHYIEASYRFAPHWETAARYDTLELNSAPEFGAPPLTHRDVAVGLNYWFNPSLVVKMSVHNVKGNGVALTDPLSPDDHTRALVFGTQFSF